MLRTRLLTALVALPTLWVFVQFLPPFWFAAFIVVVTFAALFEYAAMALGAHAVERTLGIVCGLAVSLGVASERPEIWGAALALTVVGGLALVLARPDDLEHSISRLGLIVLGVLYIGFFIPHIILLRERPDGWRWVLFTVFVAMGSDTGGYFAGRAWGRRKLLPAVSPSKTVEGAFGAVGGAMVVALLGVAVLLGPGVGWREGLGLGVAISVLAQFGDLCESALKRAFGAKDSGWIIPGHGGILDRLDSLLFPFAFSYYYATLMAG